MGILNKLFSKNKSKSTPESAPVRTQWDRLGQQQPFTGDQASDPEAERRARLKRQGDKLVAMYYQGPDALDQDRVEISDGMRDEFCHKLASHESVGGFTDAQLSNLLQNIALPEQNAYGDQDLQKVFNTVNDKHGLAIIGFVTGAGNPQQVSAESLAAVYNIAPTPIEFEAQSRNLLQALRDAGNTGLKVAEYEDDLEKFQDKIYGKRYEYYQALDYLRDHGYKQNRERARAEATAKGAEELHRMYAAQSSPEMQARIGRHLQESQGYASPESNAAFPDPDRKPN